MKNSRWLPLIYLFVLGASWGLHFSVIKIASHSGLSYAGIAVATTAGVAVVLITIAVFRQRLPIFDWPHIRFYLGCSILGYAIPFILELASAANLPASVLTLIVSSSPLVTVALALALRNDSLSPRRALGIAIGTFSAALILVPAVLGLTDISVYWMLVAFIVPVSYAAYTVYVSIAWPRKSDSFQVASGETLVALVVLVPIYFFGGSPDDLSMAYGWGHNAIAAMIGFSVVEIFLYLEIVRLAGPIFVSQANFVTVATGVFWGMVIFGERPSEWLWLSIAMLVIALYFIASDSKRRLPTS